MICLPVVPPSRSPRRTGRFSLFARLAIAAACLLACPVPVLAQEIAPEDEVREHIVVPVTPLEAADPARARALLQRLDHAARTACGDDPRGAMALRSVAVFSDCRRDALRRAVATIGSPVLSRLAAAQGDAPLP